MCWTHLTVWVCGVCSVVVVVALWPKRFLWLFSQLSQVVRKVRVGPVEIEFKSEDNTSSSVQKLMKPATCGKVARMGGERSREGAKE